MWAAMQQKGIRAGDLNDQAAADLFAYFYSARFFEMPGDAGRGKGRSRARLLDLSRFERGAAAESQARESVGIAGNSVALTEPCGNHSPQMLAETQ